MDLNFVREVYGFKRKSSENGNCFPGVDDVVHIYLSQNLSVCERHYFLVPMALRHFMKPLQ